MHRVQGKILLGLCLALSAARPAAAEDGSDARKLSARIDQRLAARWTDAKVQSAARSDDAEFLRRAYLDLTGKIPPVAEVRRFLADRSPDKRQALVEALLKGPGYVTHFRTVWRDLLLLDPDVDVGRQAALADLEKWLQQQFADDVPYDRMVRTLLTLPLDADGTAPAPRLFYLGREDKPADLAAGVTRLFLGVRLECAQCHDHPHARWTREDFWSQAAFFTKLRGPDSRTQEVLFPGTARKVTARFLDGTALPKDSAAPRTALADWVTSPKNPYFARAAVNRLWNHFFGIGLVDPVDGMTADNHPSHPELLDELARGFVAARYDFKFVIRAIMLSDAYQLSSVETRPEAASDPRLFRRMNVKALNPGQVFDSLIEATGYRTPELPRLRTRLLSRFPRTERRLEGQSSIPQALVLMNGELLRAALRLDGDSTLSAVAASPFLDTAGRIEALYLAALGRYPRPEEKTRLVKYVTAGGATGDGDQALADIFWALLNSAEFIHNH